LLYLYKTKLLQRERGMWGSTLANHEPCFRQMDKISPKETVMYCYKMTMKLYDLTNPRRSTKDNGGSPSAPSGLGCSSPPSSGVDSPPSSILDCGDGGALSCGAM
jgi:hypothetical protein